MVYLFSEIKKLFLKVISFFLGKTEIFIIILGWFLIITGALFLSKPKKARDKLFGQCPGMVKWQSVILAMYLVIFLISIGSKAKGILPKILVGIGVIITIWVFFFLKGKTYKILTEKFSRMPLSALKIYACIQIAAGVWMLILQTRIW